VLPTFNQGRAAVRRATIFATIIFALSTVMLLLGLCSRFGPVVARAVIHPIAVTMGLQDGDEGLIVLAIIAAVSASLTLIGWAAVRIFTER
jgi:hypothetical protein